MPRTTASSAHAKVIGERIRATRKTLGLTQEDVGERMGASGSYIAGVEAGRSNLTIGQLAAIAEALKVALEVQFHIPAPRPETFIEPDSASVPLAG